MALEKAFTIDTTGGEHARAYFKVAPPIADPAARTVRLHVDVFASRAARKRGDEPVFGMDFTVSDWEEAVVRPREVATETPVEVDIPSTDGGPPQKATLIHRQTHTVREESTEVHDDYTRFFGKALGGKRAPSEDRLKKCAYAFLRERFEFEGAADA